MYSCTIHFLSFKFVSGDMEYKTATSTNHYVQSDKCEENLPNDVCNACPKQPCVDGETGHKSKDHEKSEQAISENRTRQHRYCSVHKSKKLRRFCEPCEKPVCTKCITDSHNGHAVQKLSTVCKDIRKSFSKEEKRN